MSWTDYPALGERCYFLTLPNGLAVRVLCGEIRISRREFRL